MNALKFIPAKIFLPLGFCTITSTILIVDVVFSMLGFEYLIILKQNLTVSSDDECVSSQPSEGLYEAPQCLSSQDYSFNSIAATKRVTHNAVIDIFCS